MASGTNPALLLEELRGLGECRVEAKTDQIPPLERLQVDECFLAWDILLVTDRGLNAIQDVFIFVQDESELSIEAVASSSGEANPGARSESRAAAPAVTPAQVAPTDGECGGRAASEQRGEGGGAGGPPCECLRSDWIAWCGWWASW